MRRDRQFDNELLVEVNFLINYDMAMFYYVKSNFHESPYVDQTIINMNNEDEINRMFLYRTNINPLTVIMPDINSDKLYEDLYENHRDILLGYSTLYDTFYLLNTFLNNASSVSITIRCDTEEEKQRLLHAGCKSNIIVEPDRKKIDLTNYTALYLKYYMDAVHYGHIEGKHIYIATAKFNFECDRDLINVPLSVLYSDVNNIKLIDLYTKIKYRFIIQNTEGVDDNDDLFEYSTGGESEESPEGHAWYNF